MKRSLILAALLLAGCAAKPAQYGECVLPVKRNAGLGVMVEGCAAWTFGPTARQRQLFDERAAARAR